MSQAQNQAPVAASVADFVCRTHNHEIVRFEGVTVLTAMPVAHDPDWIKFMPVTVIAEQGGKSCVVWERNFTRRSFPYLVMVDDQMVIAYLMDGKVVQVETLRDLRDFAEGAKQPIADAIANKKAAAKVMNLKPMYNEKERAFIDGIRAAQAAAPVAPQVREVPPLETLATLAIAIEPALAAPVKTPQPAVPTAMANALSAAAVTAPVPVVSAAASHKAELEAAHRAKIAGRKTVIVYNRETGAPLTGIPVKENEFAFCADGQEYVTLNSDDVPVDHFKMKFSAGGKYHRKATVLVAAHIPDSVLSDFSRDSSSLRH